jgi:putative nucleotidyltransferase with HDIG domain
MLLRLLGLAVVAVLIAFAISERLSGGILGLFLLGVVAAWLRFSLHPIGYVTLTPLVSFTALLIFKPYASVLVAFFGAVVGARAFGRKPWNSTVEEAGEETLSMALSSIVVFQQMESRYSLGFAFALAALSYAACRLVFTVLRGKLQDDIAVFSTLSGTGGYLVGNIFLLAIMAFGITRTIPLYGTFGLLGLGLATIALVEFYRPWKLLSQQSDNLYTSLAIIAEAIDIKDPYTGRHSRRVAEMATKLARRLGLLEHEVNTVRIGALLHDIGKIGVSGSIIRKPATLESTELEAMQRHPVLSADIMQPVEYFKGAADLVRHHHEHYDGSGYPDGLKAEAIPIGSRIILVADGFDAMTTDRPYRKGRSSEEALRILRERSGKQFDARVVKALQEIVQET